MAHQRLKALIADDEPQLRSYLKNMLAKAWPELEVCAEAENGIDAVEAVDAHQPDIAFLDIRMPGLSGLQVAEQIAPFCRIVFVTAYDEYAVAAFEREALDYLLKPVRRERLEQTVRRLKKDLKRFQSPSNQTLERLQTIIESISQPTQPQWLQWLRVQYGDGVRLIPVQEVVYFQAGDKYTTVFTTAGESLIRKSIKDLSAEMDPDKFQQIHRSTIVNLAHIDQVSRSLTGRGILRLKNRPETLTISRPYLPFFKQM